MDNPVVIEALKYLDKVDFVIDLYDKSFVWAGDTVLKTAGYTSEEFTKLRTFDTLDKSVDQEAYKKELMNELKDKHGAAIVLCNSKTGQKIRLDMEYQIFQFEGGWYRAGKALKFEILP